MLAQITYKSLASNPDYFVICEKGVLRVVQDETTSDYAIGEFIDLQGRKKGDVLYADSIELLAENDEAVKGAGNGEKTGKELEKAEKHAIAWMDSLMLLREPDPLVDTTSMPSAAIFQTMQPTFKQAAMFLQSAVITMTPILCRFDEDTDGITSALYIHSLLEHFIKERGLPYPKSHFRAFQAEAPIFEHKHLQALQNEADDFAKKPIVLLLDHGASEESLPALEAAKADGFQLAIVDHHPPKTKALEQYDMAVHPFQNGGDSSACTSTLAYSIAANTHAVRKDWAEFAMQGDKSPFAVKLDFKEPIVLDYVADKEWTLKKYGQLLDDKNQIDILYQRCLPLREKALQTAMTKRKLEQFGPLTVQWLDISYVTDDYPPRGGIVQGLHEHFEKGPALVTVGYDDERVIFRVNQPALKLGFAANAWIGELKKLPNAIASGGGHPGAASCRLKPKKKNTILEALQKKFKIEFE